MILMNVAVGRAARHQRWTQRVGGSSAVDRTRHGKPLGHTEPSERGRMRLLASGDLTNANLAGSTLQGASLGGVKWSNTLCPDGTNSDAAGSTCVGHLGKL
jgi:hypothetical protein